MTENGKVKMENGKEEDRGPWPAICGRDGLEGVDSRRLKVPLPRFFVSVGFKGLSNPLSSLK